MFRTILVCLMGVSVLAGAVPECLIDSEPPVSNGLVGLITGEAKGFNPGPVYITVKNAGKEFTTVINRDSGKWGVLYANTSPETSVQCFQGWPGEKLLHVDAIRRPN